VLVTTRINSQGRELRAAASDDVGAYVSANEVANALSDLRRTEISAIAARGSGAELYEAFRTDAVVVADAIDERGEIAGNATLADAVRSYTGAVSRSDEDGEAEPGAASVEYTDLELGENQEAAAIALSGESRTAFDAADQAAVRAVEAEEADLATRLDDASSADVDPLVPTLAGVVAALLAAVGTLDRGRRYR
jgi:hypothetical protein